MATSALLTDLGVREVPFCGPIPEAERQRVAGAARRLAEQHPSDYPLQLALALRTASADRSSVPPEAALTHQQAYLMPLLARFPDRPSAYAQVLRLANQRGLLAFRVENYLISGDELPAGSVRRGEPAPTPEQLAVYDRLAADGERLDPGNAFFPCMRAIGLLAAGRDAEADDTLLRAARKPAWNDYADDEVEGQWRIMSEADGDSSSVGRIAVAAAVLFPHFPQIRAMARVETYRAVRAEVQGRRDEGLALRHALMRVAGLMRSDSPSIIGSLVGMTISDIATLRPGGAPARSRNRRGADEPADALVQQREAEYLAYLRGIDKSDEARWAECEFESDRRVRAITWRRPGEDWIGGAVRSTTWGIATSTAFLSIVWMLLAGLIAAAAMRGRRLRSGRPMAAAGRWGAAAGLAAAAVCAVPDLGTATLPLAVALVTAAALCGLLLASRLLRGNEFMRSALPVGLVAAATALITIPMLVQAQHGIGFALAMVGVVSNLTSGEGQGSISGPGPVLALSLAPLLVVPVVAIVLTAVSLRCRVPLTVGLARGFRGLALPVACMTAFVYVALVGCEARVETATNRSLERERAHAGRYYAEQMHTVWPGKPE
jgi:hypothetical protein